MASLTIKNIPADLYESLKQAANAHHRSINSELIVCLEKILKPHKLTHDERLTAARALRKKVATADITASDIDIAKNEGRP